MALFIALVILGTLQQTVSNPFLQVDQKGPTPFIAKRREMGREKGSASAALSKVLAELRVQPQSPESRLDALPTKLSFLLCSGFPSRCAHSQFPIHHNQFKNPPSFSWLLSGPGISVFPPHPSQPRDLLPALGCPWSRSKPWAGSSCGGAVCASKKERVLWELLGTLECGWF